MQEYHPPKNLHCSQGQPKPIKPRAINHLLVVCIPHNLRVPLGQVDDRRVYFLPIVAAVDWLAEASKPSHLRIATPFRPPQLLAMHSSLSSTCSCIAQIVFPCCPNKIHLYGPTLSACTWVLDFRQLVSKQPLPRSPVIFSIRNEIYPISEKAVHKTSIFPAADFGLISAL